MATWLIVSLLAACAIARPADNATDDDTEAWNVAAITLAATPSEARRIALDLDGTVVGGDELGDNSVGEVWALWHYLFPLFTHPSTFSFTHADTWTLPAGCCEIGDWMQVPLAVLAGGQPSLGAATIRAEILAVLPLSSGGQRKFRLGIAFEGEPLRTGLATLFAEFLSGIQAVSFLARRFDRDGNGHVSGIEVSQSTAWQEWFADDLAQGGLSFTVDLALEPGTLE